MSNPSERPEGTHTGWLPWFCFGPWVALALFFEYAGRAASSGRLGWAALSGASGTTSIVAGVLMARARPETLAREIDRLVVTVGLAGTARRGPGTLGALVALPLAPLLGRLPVELRAALLLALTAMSWVPVRRYVQGTTKDPAEVVVDEWLGCAVALAFVPAELAWMAAAFTLFRLLDIAKPWPLSWIEARHGSFGILGDDLAAGAIAGVTLALIRALSA